MPVVDFEGSGGEIFSQHDSYSVARGGAAGGMIASQSSPVSTGQIFVSLTYYVYETFFKFDTSSIPDNATINSAVLKIYLTNDQSATNFTFEALPSTWTPSLTTADFVPGASISGTVLASIATSGIGSVNSYKTLTSNGSALANHVNKTGETVIFFYSDRQDDNNAPTGNEFISFDNNSNPVILQVNYTVPPNLKSLSGTMGALSGSLTKRSSKAMTGIAGALTGAVSSVKVITKIITGSLSSPTGSIAKSTSKNIGGSLGPTGQARKTMYQSISGVMGSLSGALLKQPIMFGLEKIRTTSGIMGTITRMKSGRVRRN